jgi:hypothetical protein
VTCLIWRRRSLWASTTGRRIGLGGAGGAAGVVARRESGSAGLGDRNDVAVEGVKLTLNVLLVTVMGGRDEWRPCVRVSWV